MLFVEELKENRRHDYFVILLYTQTGDKPKPEVLFGCGHHTAAEHPLMSTELSRAGRFNVAGGHHMVNYWGKSIKRLKTVKSNRSLGKREV